MDQVWPYILSAIGVFGIYLAGSKNVLGWYVGIIAQTMWITFAIQTEQYGFIISAVAYGAVYIRNYYKWKYPKHTEKEAPRD